MTDTQLNRTIQSIGKGCFVKNFALFIDAKISNDDAIEQLMLEHGYQESGARTRVLGSRRIIASGRAKDALKIIASSERVPLSTSSAARDLALSL
ncbi:MAG: hypothetical protein H7A06_08765 [Pseudomonadales bacterium]|nr:hypothetical protein [Pseudomonadales bacterium]